MDVPTILSGSALILLVDLAPGAALSFALFPKLDFDWVMRAGLAALLGLTPAFILYFLDKNFGVPITFESSLYTWLLCIILGVFIWQVRVKRDF
ncbi:MAG: hypothetical protein GF334_10600 [Candidatus Altiarchaeales archaeon]|nr:hypothetical protein [Candidatus Altiarchaeales archaeon]